ncbi:MAG: four-carbon acid sugar kinase family protein [Alphaproteobacteria bacterium]|nr:four-carbon acid sugar kinase family protein [Alphaproteobacteria bacterium]
MIELGVLADDLTGGMMVASLMVREGVACPLVLSAEALDLAAPGAEAVVLARKIRLIPPEAAREEARQAAAAFARIGARRLYAKYSALFDSRRDGNIGPIAEALLEATGAPATLFCPAYLERDVTVYQGRLFVRATPLAESFKRNDPATPAWSSDLVEVLQSQTQIKVGLIPHKILRDPAAARARLTGAKGPFQIVDTVNEEDLTRVAALGLELPLITGADSLAPALARAWRGGAPPPLSPPRLLGPSPGAAAVLAGSCAPQTLAQLDAFEARHPVWRIDLARDGDDPDLVTRVRAWAGPRLMEGPVGIATSAGPEAVRAAQARFGRDGAAARADAVLGRLARELFALGVRKFVIAGGESSGEVLNALGVARLDVAAYDDLYGGYCRTAAPVAMSFVVKAGSVGDASFFDLALARLAEADAAPEAFERGL